MILTLTVTKCRYGIRIFSYERKFQHYLVDHKREYRQYSAYNLGVEPHCLYCNDADLFEVLVKISSYFNYDADNKVMFVVNV